MPVIKDGKLVETDPWRTLEEGEPIPGDAPVILSYEGFRGANGGLSGHNGKLGIQLRSDQPPDLIADEVARFDLIALEFPKLADGRSFSHARMLRQRHGFTGELRAVGDVFRDQIFFMLRCGFDSFAIPEDRDPAGAIAALEDFTVAYQAAADHMAPAYRLHAQKNGS